MDSKLCFATKCKIARTGFSIFNTHPDFSIQLNEASQKIPKVLIARICTKSKIVRNWVQFTGRYNKGRDIKNIFSRVVRECTQKNVA